MIDDSSGTKYLYHQDSREIFKTAFKKRTCLHSRNIVAFIDSDEKDGKLKTFMNHMENCESCKQILDKTMQTYERLDEFIPDARIPRGIQMEFEEDLSDILKFANFKSDRVESGKRIFKGFIETIRYTLIGR